MALFVTLCLILLGISAIKAGHTGPEDCCLSELCPYNCIRCDGQPTCYDLSDELGCSNRTDSILRSYPKPPIFIPAVMDMIKGHLLQQKQEMASTYTHRTCIRQSVYNMQAPTTTQWPPWMKLLEKLKPTTTTEPPVWLKLLHRLRYEASTTTTAMPTTMEPSVLDILFEWMQKKNQSNNVESRPSEGLTQYETKKPFPTSKVAEPTSKKPVPVSHVMFTSPAMKETYSKASSSQDTPTPTKELPVAEAPKSVRIVESWPKPDPKHVHVHKKSPIDSIYSERWPVYVDSNAKENILTVKGSGSWTEPPNTSPVIRLTHPIKVPTTLMATESVTDTGILKQSSTEVLVKGSTTTPHTPEVVNVFEDISTTPGSAVQTSTNSSTDSSRLSSPFAENSSESHGYSTTFVSTESLGSMSTNFTEISTSSPIVSTISVFDGMMSENVISTTTPSSTSTSTEISANPVEMHNKSRTAEKMTNKFNQVLVSNNLPGPVSRNVYETSTFKQNTMSTTGNFGMTTTEFLPDMTTINNTFLSKITANVQVDLKNTTAFLELNSSTSNVSAANTTANTSSDVELSTTTIPPTDIIQSTTSSVSSDLSSFKRDVPTITTFDIGTKVTKHDGSKTMKLFVDLSEIVDSPPNVKSVYAHRLHVSPTSASKTITALFPDPTKASRPAQPEYTQLGTVGNGKIPSQSQWDASIVPRNTKLFGRVSAKNEELKKTPLLNGDVSQLDQHTSVSGNIQVRPLQRLIGPIFSPRAVNVIPYSSRSASGSTLATRQKVAYELTQSPPPVSSPSWWQTTTAPFGFGDLWGGTTTAFPATTHNWWGPSTSNTFWNSLFGYPPTTQRNYLPPERVNDRIVTLPGPILRTTPQPIAPPTVTQAPRFQIPATRAQPTATVIPDVFSTAIRQAAPSTSPPVFPTRQVSSKFNPRPSTTTPRFPTSNSKSGSIVDTIMTLNLTSPSTTPVPPELPSIPAEFSSVAELDILPYTTTVSPSTSQYGEQTNYSINTTYKRNLTDLLGNQTDSTTSLEYLRSLYLEILAAQKSMEANNDTFDPFAASTGINSTLREFIGNVTEFDIATERTTQKFVKPYITTQSTVEQSSFNWWQTPTKPATSVVNTQDVTPTASTVLTTGHSLATTALVNSSEHFPNTPTSAPLASSSTNSNILVNSSPPLRMSNMLGITIPNMYSTVNSFADMVYDPNKNVNSNLRETVTQDYIRPTPRIESITVSYNISKPELAEWSHRGDVISKTRNPNRHSLWGKIITAVTDASKIKQNGNQSPVYRDAQTVTYDLFQTTTVPPRMNDQRVFTETGVTSKPLVYYDVTAPATGPVASARTKDCRLVRDGGAFCGSRFPGYYKNARDCHTFFVCEWSNLYLCHCPKDTLFDSTLDVCNWAYNVTC